MRLVTNTEVLAKNFGDEVAVRIFAEAGFDALDWSFFDMTNDENVWCQDDWREHAQNIKNLAQECGIGFSQAHAPFPSSNGTEEFDTKRMDRILRSMEAAAIMGVQNIVVHPKTHLPYRRNRKVLFDACVDMYRSLIPYCEKFGIRVCMENMYGYDQNRHIVNDHVCAQPEEFCAMMDTINSPWIVGCLDVGHAALVGIDPADYIRELGHDRLKALHIHDVDHLHDCHTLPFTRNLDWESILQALADIDFEGDFTFEAEQFQAHFPLELQTDATRLMEKTGRYLIGRFEALKAKK